MYIQCKKDFNYLSFDLKAGTNYPITAIYDASICFVYPDGHGQSISKYFIKEKKEYMTVVNRRLCKHRRREHFAGMLLCPVCQEFLGYDKQGG